MILRPSVVVGRAAAGGSALFRALAALPVLPRIPDAGLVDVVQLDDVAETVAVMLRPDAPSRVALELAGPERLAFPQIVAAYRNWLGRRQLPDPRPRLSPRHRLEARRPRRLVRLAAAAAQHGAARAGPRRDRRSGNVDAPHRDRRALGEALAARPASVQERWFARLYLLKPLAFLVFAGFWLVTGLVSLGPGRDAAIRLMQQTAAADWAGPLVVGRAWFDILMGVALLFRRTAGPALLTAFFATILYLVAGRC